MTYKFHLKIEKYKSKLTLFRESEVVGSIEWAEGRDMGKMLFEAMDNLLAKNNLKPKQIDDFVVDSEMPENYTSARIAETVKRAFIFGVKSRN